MNNYLNKIRYWIRYNMGPIFAIIYYGKKYECPICGAKLRKLLPAGVNKRPNAICPSCFSYERHRLEWLFFKNKTNLFKDKLKVLHFAPEECFQARLKQLDNLEYISADLYASNAMVKVDITNIPCGDNTYDCVICSHVLEHIEEDVKAVKEIYRVMKPGGWALLQVPITFEKTFQDPNIITPEDRLKYYGLKDHVRRYGLDYKERLLEGGFLVDVNKYIDNLSEKDIEKYRLVPTGENKEYLYYCIK